LEIKLKLTGKREEYVKKIIQEAAADIGETPTPDQVVLAMVDAHIEAEETYSADI